MTLTLTYVLKVTILCDLQKVLPVARWLLKSYEGKLDNICQAVNVIGAGFPSVNIYPVFFLMLITYVDKYR